MRAQGSKRDQGLRDTPSFFPFPNLISVTRLKEIPHPRERGRKAEYWRGEGSCLRDSRCWREG